MLHLTPGSFHLLMPTFLLNVRVVLSGQLERLEVVTRSSVRYWCPWDKYSVRKSNATQWPCQYITRIQMDVHLRHLRCYVAVWNLGGK